MSKADCFTNFKIIVEVLNSILGLPHFNAQQEVFEFRRQMRLVENLKLYCIVRWQFGVVG